MSHIGYVRWSHSVGSRGSTIWVGERRDKGDVVYLRRTVDRKPVFRSLAEHLGIPGPFRIRDERGRELERQKQVAIQAAQGCVEDLKLGLDPFRSSRLPTREEKGAERPTIKKAFNEALRSPDGKFVAETKHKRDLIACSEIVLAALGSDFPADEVIAGTAQVIWRFLLKEAEHLHDKRRTAEKCVSVLYSSLRWLHDRHPTRYPTAPAPLQGWKKLLRAEWGQRFQVNAEYEEQEQPRHTEKEMQKIFSGLGEADERIALMVEVCGEQRVGQVIRATRKDLRLDAGIGGYGLGALDVRRHGRGMKMGTIIDLHPEARELIDRILQDGYLADLEAAYQRGEIDDYHLWPLGKLRGERKSVESYLRGPLITREGRRVRGKPTHMHSTTLIAMFRRFERAVGIEPVKGRAFYGLRRTLADLGEDHTTDTRVLREVTGWKSDDTRRIYQKKRDPKVLKAAAETRHKVRESVRLRPEAEQGRAGRAKSTVDVSQLSIEELKALIDAAQERIKGDW